MIRAQLILLLLAVPLAPALHADTLVVDELGSGSDYLQIQDAVAAAAEGDSILVRAGGSYISFTIDGKSLEVIVERNEVAGVTGSIRIVNLAPTQSVVLRGLRVRGTSSGAALLVEDCSGPVFAEDCVLLEPYVSNDPVNGGEITNAQFVSLTRCTSEGSRAQGNIVGGHGLVVTDALVASFDSTHIGGSGLASVGSVLKGGDGVQVTGGGTLFASGGALLGGDGGFGGGPFGCTNGSDGGIGLLVTGAGNSVRVTGSQASGGAAGDSVVPCIAGLPGADIVAPAGSVVLTPWSSRSLAIDGPLRSGDTLVAEFVGEPFDLVWALLSPIQAPMILPDLSGGPLVTDLATSQVFALGSLGADGSLQLATTVPSVPVSATLFIQALMFSTGPSGEGVLSSPTALTLLADGL
jgi:hypothetical protein